MIKFNLATKSKVVAKFKIVTVSERREKWKCVVVAWDIYDGTLLRKFIKTAFMS